MIFTAISVSAALFSLWVLSGYLPTRNIDMPAYTVISQHAEYEIRHYAAYIIAETPNVSDQGSSGFNELFQFISGNNTSQAKLAMTAPVLKNDTGGGSKLAMTAPVIKSEGDSGGTIAFVMPPGYKFEELPQPKSRRIVLREISEHTVAAVTFSGYADDKTIKEKTEQLLRALQVDGVTVLSPPRTALYNPPWTPPFMRRNEILMNVKCY